MFEIKVGSEYLSRNGEDRFRVLATGLIKRGLRSIVVVDLHSHRLRFYRENGYFLAIEENDPGDLYWYAHDAEENPHFRPEGEGEMLLKNGDVIKGWFQQYNWGIPGLFPERAIIGYRPAEAFRKAHGKTFQRIDDLWISGDAWVLHTGWDTAPDLSKKVEVILRSGDRIVPLEARLLNWGIQSEEDGVIVMWRYVHEISPKAEEEVKAEDEEEIFFCHEGKDFPAGLDLNDSVDVKLRDGTVLRGVTARAFRWYSNSRNSRKDIIQWKK